MDAVINMDLMKDLQMSIPHIVVNACACLTKHMINGLTAKGSTKVSDI